MLAAPLHHPTTNSESTTSSSHSSWLTADVAHTLQLQLLRRDLLVLLIFTHMEANIYDRLSAIRHEGGSERTWMRLRWPEKVEREADRLCSSPISARTDEK